MRRTTQARQVLGDLAENGPAFVSQLRRVGPELHLARDVAGTALRANAVALGGVGALVVRVDDTVTVGVCRRRRGGWRCGNHDGRRDGSHGRYGLGRTAKQILEAQVQRPEVAVVDVEPVGLGPNGELVTDRETGPGAEHEARR